jgi:ABC-type multidrug transport system fused ATPase/permease subunit
VFKLHWQYDKLYPAERGSTASNMLKYFKNWLLSYPDGTPVLIQRLMRDHAARYAKRYATAVAWMAVGAACVSVSAYLLGSAINNAYVARNFENVAVIAIGCIGLFTLKGLAGYAQAVIMARIGSEITAENQSRPFDKLLRQDLASFGDRHLPAAAE